MIEYVRRHRGIHAFRRNGMYLRRVNHLCEHIDQGVEEGLHYRLRCVKSEYTNTGAKSKDVWNQLMMVAMRSVKRNAPYRIVQFHHRVQAVLHLFAATIPHVRSVDDIEINRHTAYNSELCAIQRSAEVIRFDGQSTTRGQLHAGKPKSLTTTATRRTDSIHNLQAIYLTFTCCCVSAEHNRGLFIERDLIGTAQSLPTATKNAWLVRARWARLQLVELAIELYCSLNRY